MHADGPKRMVRAGFTLVELVVVILIAGVIMTVATPRLQQSRAQRVARNARDAFVWNAQRARARAIQTGQTYLYEIDPATERAWIVKRNPTVASDTLVTINFQTEFESTVTTGTNSRVTICYSPRGYAFDCSPPNSLSSSTVEVEFTHATRTIGARVKPLGQVERL